MTKVLGQVGQNKQSRQNCSSGAVWSGSALITIPFASLGSITVLQNLTIQSFRIITTIILGIPILRIFVVGLAIYALDRSLAILSMH